MSNLEFIFILNSSLGELQLEHMPVGWDGAQNTLSRNMTYEGIMNNYSLEGLEFTGEGADYLMQLWQAEGIKLVCTIEQRRYNPSVGEYETIYTGILNGRTYKESDTFGGSVSMNIGEDRINERILAREKNTILYSNETSINGSEITIANPKYNDVNISGMELYRGEKWRVRNTNLNSDTGIVYVSIPMTFTDGDTTKEVEYYEVDFIEDTPPEAWTFNSGEGLATVDINFKGTVQMSPVRAGVNFNVFIADVKQDVSSAPYLENVQLKFQFDVPVIAGDFLETVEFSTSVELKENQALLILVGEIDYPVPPKVTVGFLLSSFEFVIGELPIPVTIQAIKSGDLMRHVIESITDEKGVFSTPLLDAGGAYENVMHFNGYMARLYDTFDSQYSISLEELFMSFKYMFNAGMSITPQGVVLDSLDSFYQDEVFITLDDVSKETWSRELNEEKFITQVTTGYLKAVSEEKGALLEYNSLSQYSTPMDTVKGEKDMSIKVRGDGYGITFAITFATATKTEDTRFDKHNFFIDTTKLGDEYWQRGRSGFESVVGVDEITTPINLDFTPARLLLRNSEMLTTGMKYEQNSKFVFGDNDNKNVLQTKKADEDYFVKEGQDVEVFKLKNPRFSGFILNLNWAFSFELFSEIIDNRYKKWKVKNPVTGRYHFGWILEVSHTIRTDEVNVQLLEQNEGIDIDVDTVMVTNNKDFVVDNVDNKIKING